uniref:Reverse transcriptase domain-containing protein n=1 Tax=Cannabis sativa TaxID=3483 RepID=A0A803PIN7_CANSA
MASSSITGKEVENRDELISLDEEEVEVLRIPTGRAEEVAIDTRWCLVGKLLTGRVSDFNVFQNMMAFLWQPGMGMYVKELNPNLFLFQFYHEIDIQLVIDGSPWTYDRKPFIFTRLKEGDNPRLVEINHLDMWVQLHNLQPGNMTLSVMTALGNFIGTFIESDPNNFVGVWRDFLRVRVRINVIKPIKRRMKVSTDNASWYWANFKYEKLPTFCFICGIIGHSERFCPRLLLKPLHLQEKPYTLELRACLQRRHSTFGAQWLRSGAVVRDDTRQGSIVNNSEQGVNLIPMNPEQLGGSASQNHGYDTNPIDLLNDRRPYKEDIRGVNEEDMTLHVNNNGIFFYSTIITIIDSKRRRPDSSEEGNVGPQGKAYSGNTDDMEQDMVGLPKNGLLAGSGFQARLEPNLLFLCETLCNKTSMECIRVHLGFEGCFVVDARGHSGGLALLWKDVKEVVIQGFSFNHVDATVELQGSLPWRFTGIYGEPKHLPLVGYPFTWEKERNSNDWIEERLDKALVTSDWLSIFPLPILYNLEITNSDHCPIFLLLKGTFPTTTYHSFCFENAWIREPLCKQLVEGCWLGSGLTEIQDKIAKCGEVLGKWGRDITGNFRQRINLCKNQIRDSKWGRDPISIQLHKEGKDKLSEILAQWETFWKQRSKQYWLNSSDKNSKYFHSVASSRKRNNSISQLQNNNGVWVNCESGIQGVITGYFRDLFQASGTNLGSVLDRIWPSISCEQNDELLIPVSEDEVRSALFQMHPDKSPGPDGMTPAFYQKHWTIVGTDVVQFVQDFFDSGKFPDSINDTHINLIPKKKYPTQMSDMRPISLCNVLYKIASKVVANRMKGVLSEAISETQSAFVSGRLISDNVMVAFEAMHYLKRKTNGRKGYMAIKLDMSKAYDRVEWGFLESILRVMGFNVRWIGLVLSYVNSVRYHIINSGQRMGPITPTRGIRQGCPLSPYLFIICAEGFSSLIRHYEATRLISGCKVAKGAPTISHLLFTDDSYVYCQASKEEASHVLSLLQTFEHASSQKVNLHKSSAFFSSNTRAATRTRVCNLMQIQEAGSDSMYLGLPIPIVNGLDNFNVNSLFEANTRKWDEDIVKDLFSPEDAAIILGIPLNQNIINDSWYWIAEKNGFYSVRSAYNSLQQLKQHSDISEVNEFWKKLWSLKVPPKAKDLVWRAASNCLASKRNLCIKKVLVDSSCPFCGVFAETEWHVLVSCHFAWSCFGYAGLAVVGRDSFSSLLVWLEATANRVGSEDLGRVVMLCWAIWAVRNDLVWKYRARSVKDVVTFAKSSLDQWLNAQGKGNIPSMSPLKAGDGLEQWVKPISGIKLNVDAAIFDSFHKYGYGCVVRDPAGGLVSVFAGVFSGSVAPELAEIMGIREA